MEKLIIPSILSVSDGISLSERILKILSPLSESDARVKDLSLKVSAVLQRLVKNQKNISTSQFSEKLYLSDYRRDQAFIALRDVLHGLSLALPEDTHSHASALYTVINRYGSMLYALNYKAESAMLTSLFNELDQPENQTHLSSLSILYLHESLKEAHQIFDEISRQRSEEINVHNNESEAATDILHELLPALINLVSLIQLYYHLEPGKYETLFNQMISFITEVNTLARARQTRNDKIVEPVVL